MAIRHINFATGSDAAAGTSWATAWKTITSGATAARIAPGDEIRIAKTPDPASIGVATWTNGSATVTLATPQTKTVDLCESGWVAANSATVTYAAIYRKQGSACLNVTKASYLTSTLYAYKALGSAQNFSAYQELSFWLSCDSNLAANTWKLCLCSDTAGAVIVDTITIPALSNINRPTPFAVARNGGGNLGASIQSVALYSHTSTPAAGLDIRLDCIIATKTGGLNLTSVIGKDSSPTEAPDGVWPVRAIDGITITLDRMQVYNGGTTPGTYYGTSESVESYHVTGVAVAASQATQDDGTAAARITYTGGWNPATGLQDGETVLDGRYLASGGVVLLQNSYVDIARLSVVRGASGAHIYASGIKYGATYQARFITGAFYGLFFQINGGAQRFYGSRAQVSSITDTLTGVTMASQPEQVCVVGAVKNSERGADVVGRARIDVIAGCTNYGATVSNGLLGGTAFSACSPACVSGQSSSGCDLQDCTMDGTEVVVESYALAPVYSHRHDGTPYFWQWHIGGTVNSEASDFAGGTDAMVRLVVSAATRPAAWPLSTPVAQYAVSAGALVTVEALLKKSHATNIDGRLVVRGGQLAGVPDDVVATLADNTNEQTLSLSFTPTEAGVIEVECWAEYRTSTGSVYIDSITCTQA